MRYDLRPKKINGILSRTLDGETVILRKENWKCFLLNSTATYIWPLLNGRNSIKHLVRVLSVKYDLKIPAAQKDIKILLSYLKEQGLINFVKKGAQSH